MPILTTHQIVISIPPPSKIKDNKKKIQFENLSQFLDNLTKNSGKSLSELYADIIMAFLHNSFEMDFIQYDRPIVRIEHSKMRKILEEPDLLFRVINHLDKITILTDAILGTDSRWRGLQEVYNIFQKRKFFAYMNYIGASVYETTFMLHVISSFLTCSSHFNLFEFKKVIPSSILTRFIQQIEQDKFVLAEHGLIEVYPAKSANIGFVMKPFVLELLNEA